MHLHMNGLNYRLARDEYTVITTGMKGSKPFEVRVKNAMGHDQRLVINPDAVFVWGVFTWDFALGDAPPSPV